MVGEGAKSKPHPILPICALRHSPTRPSNLLYISRLVSGGWKNMVSDMIALGATTLCCAFIGWVVVVLTSTRRERLSQRFGFRLADGGHFSRGRRGSAGRPKLVGDGSGFSRLIAYEIRACPTRMRSIAAQSHEMPTPIAEEGMA